MAVTVWLNLGKSKELPDYRDRFDQIKAVSKRIQIGMALL
jgi:hypothetical protein